MRRLESLAYVTTSRAGAYSGCWVTRMLIDSTAIRRRISTWSHFSERLKQTENEIVKMFHVPNPKEEFQNIPMKRGRAPWKDPSTQTFHEIFIRILKIFKWGPDAEKALEVLKLKVDARLVREVLKIDVEVNVKIQFFKWAGKRRNFPHDATTYMSLIHFLDEAGLIVELWKTIRDMVRGTCVINPAELSEIVKILGKAKMVNKALSVFYQVKGHNLYLCKGVFVLI